MAGFNDLSAELKLRVAEFLRMFSTPFRDLKALALVSREVAPLAQEVLHRAPKVDNYPIRHQVHQKLTKDVDLQAFAVPLEKYQLSQLCANSKSLWQEQVVNLDLTLKTRPVLAQKERALSIVLIGSTRITDSLVTRNITNPASDVAILLDKVPALKSLVLMLVPPFEIPKGVVAATASTHRNWPAFRTSNH
ncbi:hypothetical protein PSPO01_15522 [Paraphaeosphaeria sporulosa]